MLISLKIFKCFDLFIQPTEKYKLGQCHTSLNGQININHDEWKCQICILLNISFKGEQTFKKGTITNWDIWNT